VVVTAGELLVEEDYMKIIAIKECADGNESVGTHWKEVKTFDDETTLKEVMLWADKIGYKSNVILVEEKK